MRTSRLFIQEARELAQGIAVWVGARHVGDGRDISDLWGDSQRDSMYIQTPRGWNTPGLSRGFFTSNRQTIEPRRGRLLTIGLLLSALSHPPAVE